MADLQKGKSFSHDVIIVDGLWGSGKSILSSLIGSLDGVEKKRIDHIFEYIAVGASLGKVSADFAKVLINIYTDLDQYNNLVGREVNLRFNDDSGFRNTPGSSRYLKRLIGGEGDSVVDVINDQNLALLLVTHHVTGVSGPLFESLKGRLHLIEVIRHPLQLVNYWTTYLENFERSREFTLGTQVASSRVPWFALKWIDEFIAMRPIDRAIRSIYEMQTTSSPISVSGTDTSVGSTSKPILTVAFEHLIGNTHQVLQQVSQYLDRSPTKFTRRAIRRQKVPRQLSSRGKASNPMSWLPNPRLTYEEQLNLLRQQIGAQASAGSILLLDTAIKNYEQRLLTLSESLHIKGSTS